MRCFLLLVFAISFSHTAKSQIVFSPSGAEWRYSFFWGFPYEMENEKIAYVRDSTLGATQVKVLTHRKFYRAYNAGGNNLTVLKQSADTVFFRSELTQHTWQVLYNFAALPGQSWNTTIQVNDINGPPLPLVTYTVTVDSVKNVVVNSVTLKRLFVRYIESSIVSYNAVITERFGADPFMFNYNNQIDASDYDIALYFLCYKDDAFGVKQFTNYSCEYSDYMSISENAAGLNFGVYPNPSSDVLHIKELNSYPVRKMEIADALGKVKMTIEANEIQDKIDICRLSEGMYFLKIFIGQQPLVFKFMKQIRD